MKVFNAGILAHVDAGKTTLTEQLLYHAGCLRQTGSVDKGTAQTDFLDIERARGISVKSAGATLFWQESQINLIDTPGHVDFIGEVERVLTALDVAILVISAAEGIQAQTQTLYRALRQTGTNLIFFINKIDGLGWDVQAVFKQIKEELTSSLLMFSLVQAQGEKTCQVQSAQLSQPSFREAALLAVAEQDQIIQEKYLLGQSISDAMLEQALGSQIRLGQICPVLCGSAALGVGMEPLLDFLAQYGEPIKNQGQAADPLGAVIYQVAHDKAVGTLAHVRLFSGCIKNRDLLRLPAGEGKVTQIRRYSGGRFSNLKEVAAGDIAVLCGLAQARVGDVIGQVYGLKGYKMAVPLLKVQVLPAQGQALYPLLEAFTELTAEDPQLAMTYEAQEQALHISVAGAIQLEVLQAIVKERYGLDVCFSAPGVIYRETPLRKAMGFERYTMPKPCWAIIELAIEPLAAGEGWEFQSMVSKDQIFDRYQKHIATAVERTLEQGLYNWQVTDLKVTLMGGQHHIVHTHPMDFFLAAPMALMSGLQQAGTTLLEPVQQVRLTLQAELLNKVLGDVIAMRGEFDSPVNRNGLVTLEARLPVATSLDYSIRLACLTSGKGLYSSHFVGYQPCPLELGAVAKRRGINPLEREKWILSQRGALKK